MAVGKTLCWPALVDLTPALSYVTLIYALAVWDVQTVTFLKSKLVIPIVTWDLPSNHNVIVAGKFYPSNTSMEATDGVRLANTMSVWLAFLDPNSECPSIAAEQRWVLKCLPLARQLSPYFTFVNSLSNCLTSNNLNSSFFLSFFHSY